MSNKKKISKKPLIKSGLKRPIIYLALGLGLVAATTIAGVRYVESEFDSRVRRSTGHEIRADQKVYIGGQTRPFTFWDKAENLYLAFQANRNYSKGIEAFLSWLDVPKNRKSLESLVDVDHEKCGTVASKPIGFQFEFVEPELRKMILQYATELRKRDFTHANEAASYAYGILRGLQDMESANLMVKFLSSAPEIERKIKSGEWLISNPLVKDYFMVLNMTADALEFYSKACPRDLKIPNAQGYLAAFHTHFFDPKLNPNPPSPGDISNTIMLGPSIVFSFPTKETLAVYTIKEGTSRLAREYAIRNQN